MGGREYHLRAERALARHGRRGRSVLFLSQAPNCQVRPIFRLLMVRHRGGQQAYCLCARHVPLFRRLCEPRASGTLFDWLLSMDYIVCRIDERNMGECLGEIADETLSESIVFFREEADVVA